MNTQQKQRGSFMWPFQWKWGGEECRRGGCCRVAFLESLQLIRERQIQRRKDADAVRELGCDPAYLRQWIACVSLHAVAVSCTHQLDRDKLPQLHMCCVTSSRRAKQQEGRKRDEVTAVVLPVAPSPFFCHPASSCGLLLCQFQGQDAGAAAF